MSTYVTMEGRVVCPDRDDFERVKAFLCEGEWVKDGIFVDEGGSSITGGPAFDEENLTIDIPYFPYCNLGRANLTEPHRKGRVVSVCTDGCREGCVWEDGEEKVFNLVSSV